MKIKVKAKQGIKVFMPMVITSAPGRKNKILEGDEVIEVDSGHRFIKRRLKIGDLEIVREQQVAPKKDQITESILPPDEKHKTRKRKATSEEK